MLLGEEILIIVRRMIAKVTRDVKGFVYGLVRMALKGEEIVYVRTLILDRKGFGYLQCWCCTSPVQRGASEFLGPRDSAPTLALLTCSGASRDR